jgi:uncharacterized membrane protein YheB (UPF0754 family)
MNYWLFLLPFIAALIGWIIGKMATWSLFYPLDPKKILGFTLQGVWPRRQPAIADGIAKFVVQEFSSLNLEQKIADPSNLSKATPVIESHIDHFLRVKLKEQMPMISMFIGDKTIDTLKGIFLKELENLFPEVMKQFAGNMKTDLGIERIVKEKISGISSDYVQKLLSKELRSIAVLCAFTGFITALIQIIIIILFF